MGYNKNKKRDGILDTISSMTKREKLELEAHLLGYQKLPPTIKEFLYDEYYLGGTYGKFLYKYWLPILEDIFPDQIHTNYDTIVLTGCIGSGKSTISNIISLYNRCRLDHLENFDFFELASGKHFVMSYFHTVAQTVEDTFLTPLQNIKNSSPYFSSGLLNNPTIDEIPDTPRGKGPIGLDVILYVFSEVNFIKPEVARSKLNTAFNRLSARFEKAKGYFGTIIIDSSAAESGSFVDEFIEERCDPETTLIVRPKIWEVKPHIYGNLGEGLKGWFDVYLGDSSRDPFIINEESQDKDSYFKELGLDKDRVLRVPKELYTPFKLDINLSLNDHAGISTTSNDFFISDRKSLSKVFTGKMLNQEVVELDFYDDSSIMDYLLDSIKCIPKDKVLSIRFDIGVVSDYTGLSICYFNGWDVKEIKVNDRGVTKTKRIKIPKFKNAVNAAIGRLPGQETSITKLYEFVKELSFDYEIGAITADQFQSRQLLQDLKKEKFNAYEISVDRTDRPYQELKLIIYEGRIELPQSKLLHRELRELQYSRKNGKGKVDHPEITSSDTFTYGKGSKDCADGLAGAIEAIQRDLETFTLLSKKFVESKYVDNLKYKTSSNKDIILSDIKKIMVTGGYEKFIKKQKFNKSVINKDFNPSMFNKKQQEQIEKSNKLRRESINDD